jgi:ribose 5-phosphate isomerase B
MKIFISADHAGFRLKEKLIPFLENLKYEVIDKGAFKFDIDDDYPDVAILVAEEISKSNLGTNDIRGIILGGSGQGEAMVANRFPYVRAIVFNGQYQSVNSGIDIPNEISASREHNNSNILAIGARFLNEEEAKSAVEQWLKIRFTSEERHVRRIKKIDEIKTI